MHSENDIQSLKYLILQWLRGAKAFILSLCWCDWEHQHDNTPARTFNAVHNNFPAKHNSPQLLLPSYSIVYTAICLSNKKKKREYCNIFL